jgi:hypothetical protein
MTGHGHELSRAGINSPGERCYERLRVNLVGVDDQ